MEFIYRHGEYNNLSDLFLIFLVLIHFICCFLNSMLGTLKNP